MINLTNKSNMMNSKFQETIIRKKFKIFLEIGCYKNELFDFIPEKYKV